MALYSNQDTIIRLPKVKNLCHDTVAVGFVNIVYCGNDLEWYMKQLISKYVSTAMNICNGYCRPSMHVYEFGT